MRRTVPALLLVVALLAAGCTTPDSGAPTSKRPAGTATTAGTPAGTATTTLSDATSTTGIGGKSTERTTTDSTTGTSGQSPVDVEYTVSTREIPEEFERLTVTLQVVFVEQSGDVPACWRDTYRGPYKPTPTPIAMPQGDCHRSTPVTLNLAELDGNRSLGTFTAPGRFDAGHGLIVTNVSATYRNGTTVDGIRGTGGYRANVVEGRPDGSYHVIFGVDSYTDRRYDYWLLGEAIER